MLPVVAAVAARTTVPTLFVRKRTARTRYSASSRIATPHPKRVRPSHRPSCIHPYPSLVHMYNPLVRPRESTRARGRRDSACSMPPPRSRRRAPLPLPRPSAEASCARSCHVAAAQRDTWPPRARGDVDALAVVVPHTMLLFPSPSRSRRNHDAITSSSLRHQRATSSRGARLSRAQAMRSCCAQAESLDAASSSRASRLRARM